MINLRLNLLFISWGMGWRFYYNLLEKQSGTQLILLHHLNGFSRSESLYRITQREAKERNVQTQIPGRRCQCAISITQNITHNKLVILDFNQVLTFKLFMISNRSCKIPSYETFLKHDLLKSIWWLIYKIFKIHVNDATIVNTNNWENCALYSS